MTTDERKAIETMMAMVAVRMMRLATRSGR
jgi:hypothetical protein